MAETVCRRIADGRASAGAVRNGACPGTASNRAERRGSTGFVVRCVTSGAGVTTGAGVAGLDANKAGTCANAVDGRLGVGGGALRGATINSVTDAASITAAMPHRT
jgi:hypothetical protein